MSVVHVEVDQHDDHLVLRWSDARSSGSARFDRVPGTSPEWLGSGDDLLERATRRQEASVLDAVRAWASAAGLELGVWYDDAGVEQLS